MRRTNSLKRLMEGLARHYYGEEVEVLWGTKSYAKSADPPEISVAPNPSNEIGKRPSRAQQVRLLSNTVSHEIAHLIHSDLDAKRKFAQYYPDLTKTAMAVRNVMEDQYIDHQRLQEYPGQRRSQAYAVDLVMDNSSRRPAVDTLPTKERQLLEAFTQVAYAGYAKGISNVPEDVQTFAAKVKKYTSAVRYTEDQDVREELCHQVMDEIMDRLPYGERVDAVEEGSWDNPSHPVTIEVPDPGVDAEQEKEERRGEIEYPDEWDDIDVDETDAARDNGAEETDYYGVDETPVDRILDNVAPEDSEIRYVDEEGNELSPEEVRERRNPYGEQDDDVDAEPVPIAGEDEDLENVDPIHGMGQVDSKEQTHTEGEGAEEPDMDEPGASVNTGKPRVKDEEDIIQDMEEQEKDGASGGWWDAGDPSDYHEPREEDERRARRIREETRGDELDSRKDNRDERIGQRRGISSSHVRSEMKATGLREEIEDAFRRLKTKERPVPSTSGEDINMDAMQIRQTGVYDDKLYMKNDIRATGNRNIVVALDLSGSMDQEQTKIAIAALITAANQIGDNVGVVGFYTSSYVQTALIKGCGEEWRWEILDSFKTQGGTPMPHGIVEAKKVLDIAEDAREELIIVATDGMPNKFMAADDHGVEDIYHANIYEHDDLDDSVDQSRALVNDIRKAGYPVIGFGIVGRYDTRTEMKANMQRIFDDRGFVLGDMTSLAQRLVEIYRQQLNVTDHRRKNSR